MFSRFTNSLPAIALGAGASACAFALNEIHNDYVNDEEQSRAAKAAKKNRRAAAVAKKLAQIDDIIDALPSDATTRAKLVADYNRRAANTSCDRLWASYCRDGELDFSSSRSWLDK